MIEQVYTTATAIQEKLSGMTKEFKSAVFEKNIPLGGIAAENIYLGGDGALSKSREFCDGSILFCTKAEKGGRVIESRVLQTSEAKDISLAVFEKAESSFRFPFAKIRFSDSSFPGDIRLVCFSPFIPLGDTDSGIPAVMFEFEVTNKSSETLDFSFCALTSNFDGGRSRMGCTDTGEAYIFMTGGNINSQNTCISTDGKNVSFCEYMKRDDFSMQFTSSQTLENNPIPYEDGKSCGALCTHFALSCGETKKVRFCVSIYNPYGKYTRNYYAQYFESSMECASYFFRHYDRLHADSALFSDTLFSSTIPEDMKESINAGLINLCKNGFSRLSGGALYCESDKFPKKLSETYALSYLFPAVEYSQVSYLIKNFSDCFGGIDFSARPESTNDASNTIYDCQKQLLCILRCARFFDSSSDSDLLIEDWYYISRCIDFFTDQENPYRFDKNRDGILCYPEHQALYASALKAGANLAYKAGDKKRFEVYSSLYEKAKNISGEETPPVISFDSYPTSDESLAVLSYVSGFEYDSFKKHIGFSPLSDKCPLDIGDTFRCFFCTPDAYGYVEEGIDYIEINLLYGRLTLRSFGVPRKPRLVQYGGRNWRFTDKGLCAYLDSDLEITPRKKLTILIDIKD